MEWAFLRADQASSASYTPHVSYQGNSTGVANTVSRSSVGVYTASLPGLVTMGGVVHVTAYGSGAESCKVSDWNPNATAMLVGVRCFNASGSPVDAQFTLSYANPVTPDASMAFLWADQPLAASYTPNPTWQFNSSGASNTVQRSGVGSYTASLPNLGIAAGHVQVTAYGTGSERCKVENWGSSGTAENVRVRCFNSSGSAVDTRFTLTYVIENSLIGGAACCQPDPGESGAYVWANKPAAASYTPSLSYQWNDFGAVNTVDRLGVGRYAVHFTHHSLSWGHVQVTAYGSGSEHCKVESWMTATGALVRCFDSAGNPVDTRFDIAFLDRWQGF